MDQDERESLRRLQVSNHVLQGLEILWEDITKFANILLLLPFAPGHYREFHRPSLLGQNVAIACRIVQILKDPCSDVSRSVCV